MRKANRALQPSTSRQLEIHEFLFDLVRRHGRQPSRREIREHFGLASPHAVFPHLKFLELKGWVIISRDESRATRFLRRPDGRRPFQAFREL